MMRKPLAAGAREVSARSSGERWDASWQGSKMGWVVGGNGGEADVAMIDERQSGGRERPERKSERSGAECGLGSVTVLRSFDTIAMTIRKTFQCYYLIMNAAS